ncbi:MAG: exodeoxyribonuclease IX [Gammaproteobacteria bacterium]|nr:exodeoxyribonuclease IX [Gammaproteobacteria bacterium]
MTDVEVSHSSVATSATAANSLYLIDASIYIFRAYFTVSDTVTDNLGEPFNAVYGYGHFLCDVLEQTSAEYVGVAFDESLTTSFRNDLYPAYKANRELPPAELVTQFEQCKALTEAVGLSVFSSQRYEADDLIGTIAHRMRNAMQMIIVSADKDLTQILDLDDLLWDFSRNRRFRVTDVASRFGVTPGQIPDYLALAGDPVDNIPGVAGIGPKTAARLLASFGDLDGIYRNIDAVAELGFRGARRASCKLREGRERVYLWRRLATVAVDAPIQVSMQRLRRRPVESSKVDSLLNLVRPGRLHGRIMRMSENDSKQV